MQRLSSTNGVLYIGTIMLTSGVMSISLKDMFLVAAVGLGILSADHLVE